MSQLMNGLSLKSSEDDFMQLGSFEDLDRLWANSNRQDIERAIRKYSNCLAALIQNVKHGEGSKRATMILNNINEMMKKEWAVPTHGHELG